MKIVGCDFHPRWQQVAVFDAETGEINERKLMNGDGEAERFYRGLEAPVLIGIEAAGAGWLYLPPYSPDLNPIEKAWSKLKELLRFAKTRTRETLDLAISELLPQITPENAQAWFRLRLGTTQ